MSKCHFTPDYTFSNPMAGTVENRAAQVKMLKIEQKQMKGDFDPQIMCNPEPESERIWHKNWELFCGLKARKGVPGALEGDGQIVILSDPAPWKEGSFGGLTEKIRGDGTKDYWSISALRIRIRGDVQEVILLSGSHSMTWTNDEGCDESCSHMHRWRSTIFFSEDPDGWHSPMVNATRRAGMGLRRSSKGGPFKYQIYNKANRKTGAFVSLASLARDGLFYICDETCSDEFLYGDEEHTGFLTQARKARKVDKGKWNLRFDDDIDCVSRVRDPNVMDLAPSTSMMTVEDDTLPPWLQDRMDRREQETAPRSRCRHWSV